jgi:DNA adenine methylase
MPEVKRPLVRYHGSKWAIAPWIISYIPKHRVYVEPYGGGAAILLRKSRVYEEIYNDLDGDIVNLFRIARDNGEELKRLIELTPFSREEYLKAYKPTDDPIEQARRTVIRAFMGRYSTGATGKISDTGSITTGFKAKSDGAVKAWASYPGALQEIIRRLKGVVIENKDALEVIDQHDSIQTLFYVDPPYLLSTRDEGTDYRHEMTAEDHVKLAEKLNQVKGAVLVSGYHSSLYDELYKGWERREKNTYADGALPRVEVLWMKGIDLGLFGGDYQ